MTEEIKTNNTGINPSDAQLPAQDNEDGQDDTKRTEPEPTEPESDEPSPEQLRAAQIAAEDRVKRRELMLVIQRYYNSQRFAKFITQMNLVEDLNKKTIPEMEAMLRDIQFCIANRNASNSIQQGVPQVICALEPLISRWYDVKGLATTLQRSECFQDTLEEVALQSQTFTHAPPMRRMFVEIIKSAFFIHEANALKEKAKVAEKPITISPETANLMS